MQLGAESQLWQLNFQLDPDEKAAARAVIVTSFDCSISESSIVGIETVTDVWPAAILTAGRLNCGKDETGLLSDSATSSDWLGSLFAKFVAMSDEPSVT